jgi:hypothetical protein
MRTLLTQRRAVQTKREHLYGDTANHQQFRDEVTMC